MNSRELFEQRLKETLFSITPEQIHQTSKISDVESQINILHQVANLLFYFKPNDKLFFISYFAQYLKKSNSKTSNTYSKIYDEFLSNFIEHSFHLFHGNMDEETLETLIQRGIFDQNAFLNYNYRLYPLLAQEDLKTLHYKIIEGIFSQYFHNDLTHPNSLSYLNEVHSFLTGHNIRLIPSSLISQQPLERLFNNPSDARLRTLLYFLESVNLPEKLFPLVYNEMLDHMQSADSCIKNQAAIIFTTLPFPKNLLSSHLLNRLIAHVLKNNINYDEKTYQQLLSNNMHLHSQTQQNLEKLLIPLNNEDVPAVLAQWLNHKEQFIRCAALDLLETLPQEINDHPSVIQAIALGFAQNFKNEIDLYRNCLYLAKHAKNFRNYADLIFLALEEMLSPNNQSPSYFGALLEALAAIANFSENIHNATIKLLILLIESVNNNNLRRLILADTLQQITLPKALQPDILHYTLQSFSALPDDINFIKANLKLLSAIPDLPNDQQSKIIDHLLAIHKRKFHWEYFPSLMECFANSSWSEESLLKISNLLLKEIINDWQTFGSRGKVLTILVWFKEYCPTSILIASLDKMGFNKYDYKKEGRLDYFILHSICTKSNNAHSVTPNTTKMRRLSLLAEKQIHEISVDAQNDIMNDVAILGKPIQEPTISMEAAEVTLLARKNNIIFFKPDTFKLVGKEPEPARSWFRRFLPY